MSTKSLPTRTMGWSPKKKAFGFLLLPEYSMIALTSAVEPLRMANYVSKHELFSWHTFSKDGKAIAASNGLAVEPDNGISNSVNLDAVFVCGGINIEKHGSDPALIRWLRDLANSGVEIGGLCTGAYMLAKADLIGGRRCTVHWELFDTFRKKFPKINLTQKLFEIDRRLYTCAGGQAPADMILGIIHQQHGGSLALDICDEFMYEKVRDTHSVQRPGMKSITGAKSAALCSVIALMAANIEEPVSLPYLAKHANMSGRHLQRMFKNCLNVSPNRYYLNMRLERARELLLLTEKPILDVGISCGFYSAPHFSKVYRLYFGVTPRDDRRGGLRPNMETSEE